MTIDATSTQGYALRTGAIFAGLIIGTGSYWDVNRFDEWGINAPCPIVARPSLPMVSHIPRPDMRSIEEHLNNIRTVIRPSMTELASLFGVSRQAVYQWLKGVVQPDGIHEEKLRQLSNIADQLKAEDIERTDYLLKLKVFGGKSYLEMFMMGTALPEHLQLLIAEEKAMTKAYHESGLANIKSPSNESWKSTISIPGFFESI